MSNETIDYNYLTRAHIYLRERWVGVLEKSFVHKYMFSYNKDYVKDPTAIPISHSFPIAEQPYIWGELHPFFDNLILEGWLLQQAEKNFHIDKKNRFAMLMAIGRNTIGAVYAIPAD